jgi:hypothetical protein
VIVAGCFCYVTIALLTGLVRGDDLEKAGNELKPRAAVPHVRITLKLIGLLESYRRMMRGKNG